MRKEQRRGPITVPERVRTWWKLLAALLLIPLFAAFYQGSSGEERSVEEHLNFQTHTRWSPKINLDADVAINYGIDPSLPERIATWRQRGYQIEVMTGVAWGQYQDYLNGQYDGKKHWDEAQTVNDGSKILHGGNAEIPYISPSEAYGHYLTVGVQRALDAGAQALYLEEPEFWARGGWSPSFQREWLAHYKEPWQAPDGSVDAQYRASKLKYFLYRRTLSQVFDYVRDYGSKAGKKIRCYVPTHSLINYANWRIVSPESSLIDVGVDGYIAQVWTGTARTPNVYEGRLRERTFETAFLEYGAMQNLVRASGRRVWYLNDPIEDNPNHSWDDYRRNWESTLTASLLQPEVWRYEIMPWPERIFNGKYPVKDTVDSRPLDQLQRTPTGTGLGGFSKPNQAEKIGIPPAYATELQVVIRALGQMKQPPAAVQWQSSGTEGIGVLVSDTMMFQRADPTPSDANLGSFYGLALPLVKRGMPVEPVQIESAAKQDFLSRYRILLLTYEGQKPPTPEFHNALAEWVRAGGALVVVDDDRDPYNSVREWWNTKPNSYRTPREHLFEMLGVPKDATGMRQVGSGFVIREVASAAALTYRTDGAGLVRNLVHRAAERVKLAWRESPAIVLRRGPYLVAAGLDESLPEASPVVLRGRFVDLFDPQLPLMNTVILSPGKRVLLFDLDKIESTRPAIVAAASRIRDEQVEDETLRFRAEGIGDTQSVVLIAARDKPSKVLIGGREADASQYEISDGTVKLQFPNSVDGVAVEIRFRHSGEPKDK